MGTIFQLKNFFLNKGPKQVVLEELKRYDGNIIFK